MEEDIIGQRNEIFTFDNPEFAEDVLSRFKTWKIKVEPFVEHHYVGKHELVLIEKHLLMASKSYFDDIYKFKYYTDSDRVAKYKKASFTMKWIAKYKPIHIQVNAKYSKRIEVTALKINYLFALKCACAHISDTFFFQLMERKDITRVIFYNLNFREICGKGYALTFKLMDELLNPV